MKIKTTSHIETPYVGQHVTVYGEDCEIIRVLPLGTIDVLSLDGKKAWRIIGLTFLDRNYL
jgi:hypothetical protein